MMPFDVIGILFGLLFGAIVYISFVLWTLVSEHSKLRRDFDDKCEDMVLLLEKLESEKEKNDDR